MGTTGDYFRKVDSVNKEIILAFCKAMEVRDEYTMRHNHNVAIWMSCLAETMQLSLEERHLAYLSGLVHDIGKLGIPEIILNKSDRLTEEEFIRIKTHPVVGAEILEEISGFSEIARVVYHHHERFDGRGYPDGLSGKDIPFLSRMLTLCDSYDAMVSNRCYKLPLSHRQAIKEIKRCAGSQFDPNIVTCFLEMMKIKYGLIQEPIAIKCGH